MGLGPGGRERTRGRRGERQGPGNGPLVRFRGGSSPPPFRGAPSRRVSRNSVPLLYHSRARGAIAQLGERLHGMQEVQGSNPCSSTNSPLTRKRDRGCPPAVAAGLRVCLRVVDPHVSCGQPPPSRLRGWMTSSWALSFGRSDCGATVGRSTSRPSPVSRAAPYRSSSEATSRRFRSRPSDGWRPRWTFESRSSVAGEAATPAGC